ARAGGYMVAFAGQKYAARSLPVMFADDSYIIISFTLLTFSGTDKNLDALNSWYEVKNLRQYSLTGLYTDLRDSIIRD
ncbi:CSL zinc finger domain-containing protein, partial [Trifolium medium]|nr:CSL zinc finger domain-containing protein [Trifolium medium]